MKEADMKASMNDFIDRTIPLWVVRAKFPKHQVIFYGPTDEFVADVILQNFAIEPPVNEKGKHAKSARKVRIR